MITGVKVRHFKSWRASEWIVCAPITMFFGSNSSGTTSLLQRCRQVAITLVGDGRECAEFPDDPARARFDRSDRKCVAVARACPSHPPGDNAVDRDWVHYRQLLAMHNVQIVQVCQSE
ncbi:hypothetical protein [Chloroflexus sp.]|uniref:hypothetical protein n=1 Tax=Chloroflexus sp. TaxID=1904827 RepID=UPI00404AC77B